LSFRAPQGGQLFWAVFLWNDPGGGQDGWAVGVGGTRGRDEVSIVESSAGIKMSGWGW